LNNRIFHIIFIILILLWIRVDRFLHIGANAYGWILLLYLSVLFCGTYFIRMGFFMKSVCSVKTDERIIALTFDDGPDPARTKRILDILKDNEVEAAFFCIGHNIPGNEQILKRIIEEGHMIGNHSYSHDRLFDLFSPDKMLSDIRKMSRICSEVTGLSPRFFRPPFGVTNPHLKRAVMRAGFISIGWSIRSYDTVIKKADRLQNKLLRTLKPGAIVLLHDTSDSSLQMLPALLNNIRRMGYRMVRLDKMINLNPYD
jgi:peptidoglycan/xylan/chitin deacetylase (PgdA/CDA1 family)